MLRLLCAGVSVCHPSSICWVFFVGTDFLPLKRTNNCRNRSNTKHLPSTKNCAANIVCKKRETAKVVERESSFSTQTQKLSNSRQNWCRQKQNSRTYWYNSEVLICANKFSVILGKTSMRTKADSSGTRLASHTPNDSPAPAQPN